MIRTYDLVMTHKLDADDFFIHRVQQHCSEKGLNFFLIDPTWVEAFFEKYKEGKIWSRVLLNMHSEHHQPEDIYHRLVNLAFERKTRVIDPPDLAREAFDKASLHPRLLAGGFKLPETVIVPYDTAGNFKLSDADRERLGSPFVIKPGLGYGKKGVILDAISETDIERSFKQWADRHYLFQKKIVPKMIEAEPAYFRLFFAFGSVWFCWWNCFTDRYRILTPEEMARHQLTALEDIVCRLAAFSRMDFFSTEVAVTDSGEFVLIDYINDQCHMLTQSSSPHMGVPDDVVAGIARRLVEGAHHLIRSGSI